MANSIRNIRIPLHFIHGALLFLLLFSMMTFAGCSREQYRTKFQDPPVKTETTSPRHDEVIPRYPLEDDQLCH